MADKDSWWQDTTKSNGEKSNGQNPFTPRDTTNDSSDFTPRSLSEVFEPKIETSEKK